jgi:polyhydroxyalkanoate synthesis regulator phasin
VHALVEDTSQGLTSSSKRLLNASRGAVSMTREEADHLMSRGENLLDKLVDRGQTIEQEQTGRLSGWLKSWQKRGRQQFGDAEEQMEQQVQNVLRALHVPSTEDVQRLDKEIDRIAHKLDAYLSREIELPIQGYPEMTVKEILPLLDGLTREQLEAIKAFELANDNRVTVLRDIDGKLEAMDAEAETA